MFEIHFAFDHLKRIYIDKDDLETCSQKAYSHLKRGLLDAFKLKLKYFNDDCNKLLCKKADLRIIDSGTYLIDLLRDKKVIFDKAKSARLNESQKDIDKAFEYWCETSGLINTFEDKYFDSEKIKWAEKQSFFHFGANFLLGIITGIIGSIIVSFIF